MNQAPKKDGYLEDLERYLLVHECEIAIDENDFGALFRVFKALIGREPEGIIPTQAYLAELAKHRK